jgi:hypothetical protein
MSLVKELQQLIQIDSHISGRVIAVSGSSIVVATTSGQMEVSAIGDLHIGDLVVVNADRATKKQRSGYGAAYFV